MKGYFENISDPNELIRWAFEGMGFSGFVFHTGFQLRFIREKKSDTVDGRELPSEINLFISSDCWFGEKEEWDLLVEKMTVGYDYIEPGEPVFAFMLAALRWKEGSVIKSARVLQHSLEIIFECGDNLMILNNGDMGLAWDIEGYNNKDRWSIVCENEKIVYEPLD